MTNAAMDSPPACVRALVWQHRPDHLVADAEVNRQGAQAEWMAASGTRFT